MESSASDNFMKEVRDNFLLCKLCEKDFTTPKTLPCMHTFCQDCLTLHVDEQTPGDSKQTYRYSTYCKPISCPVCRRRTDITKDDINSLPDNFLISSLSGLIKYKSEELTSCQICSRRPKGRQPVAVKKCLECSKQLCKRCVAQHQEMKVTQSHTLCSLDNVQSLMCTEHDDEGVRYICRTCSKCVCVFCTYTTHKGHDIISVIDGMQTCRQEMDDTMKSCNRQMDSITSQLQSIQTWQLCYNETKELILNTAAAFQTQVENQRQFTLAKLDELYGSEALDMMNKKDQLADSLQNLSVASKYEDFTSGDAISLEAILIQNEIQNKIKHLLKAAPPVPSIDLPSSDVSVSFEKGGLSLGALVTTEEGKEEPCYYDADATEDDDFTENRNWCRKCRSRSRSRSRGTDMFNTRLASDTDISLTDVSALGTITPPFSKHTFGSLASDMNELVNEVGEPEPGIDYTITVTCQDTADAGRDMMTSAVPDVVPSTRQMIDSACQYEAPAAEQCFASSQTAEAVKHTCESSTQYTLQVTDSECQSDLLESQSRTTQCRPDMASCETMTNLQFPVSQGAFLVGEDTVVNMKVHLIPLIQKSDQTTMTTQLIATADQSTTTLHTSCTHQTTSTDRVHLSDTASGPTSMPVANTQSQTNSTVLSETGTNTSSLLATKNVETNTALLTRDEKFSQTSTSKCKSRGVTARPTTAELGISVKPFGGNAFTNTEVIEVGDNESQTVSRTSSHKATNTSVASSTNRGITAHIPGVDNQTSTLDLVRTHRSATQTEHNTSNAAIGSQATTCNADNSTNTSKVESKNIACGLDISIHRESVGVGTAPLPALCEIGVNATETKTDSWTNPVIQPTFSKACGTERVKHRNVGLYVRPLSMNNSTMTRTVHKVDTGCGDDEPHLLSSTITDTEDLVTYSHSQTNTDNTAECEMRTKHSQTRVVSLSDNFTVMLPRVMVDRYTNTPHQIPQQVLDLFQYPNPAEQSSRAAQTEWSGYECPSCLSALDRPGSMQRMADEIGSMSANDHLPMLSVSIAEIKENKFTQFESNSSTNYFEKTNPYTPRVPVTPVMCDKSTNTASLSTLLHPDQASSHCVDNKISECIVKLRQVTKKLQKSSGDVSRSEHAVLSSTLCDQPNKGGLNSTSSSLTLAASSLTRSDSAAMRKFANTWRKHRIVSPPSLYAETATASSDIRNPPKSAPQEAHSNVERSKRIISATRHRKPLATSEQESSPTHPSELEGQQLTASRSDSMRQWDLKTLVHEEDRKRRQMRRSTEQLNTIPPLASRTESNSSVESQPMFSAESSLYGSTESLQTSSSKEARACSRRDKLSNAFLPCTNPNNPPVSQGVSLEMRGTARSHGSGSSAVKSKARTKQLQTSAMLGNNGKSKIEPSQSSSKISSVTSSQFTTRTREVKLIPLPTFRTGVPYDRSAPIESNQKTSNGKKLSAECKAIKSPKKTLLKSVPIGYSAKKLSTDSPELHTRRHASSSSSSPPSKHITSTHNPETSRRLVESAQDKAIRQQRQTNIDAYAIGDNKPAVTQKKTKRLFKKTSF